MNTASSNKNRHEHCGSLNIYPNKVLGDINISTGSLRYQCLGLFSSNAEREFTEIMGTRNSILSSKWGYVVTSMESRPDPNVLPY